MTAVIPGCDEVVLSAPDGARLCSSRGCADAGTLAEVIVTFGVLSDPGASICAREALWRECWGSSRQVAVRYRPGLVVIDATGGGLVPAAVQPAGGRA